MSIPYPRSRLILWSRKAGSAVPSRVSLLISTLRLNRVLPHGNPPAFVTASIYTVNRHTPSYRSRVYQVTQLRYDVHCRESVDTGLLKVVKVVPARGAAFSGITMDQFLCASLFSHPLNTIVILVQWTCVIQEASKADSSGFIHFTLLQVSYLKLTIHM